MNTAIARPPSSPDALDDERFVVERVAGQVHTSPRPAPAHARASSSMGMDVGSPYDRGRGGPGGWWILDEPELHLGADVLVPDLAGWRRERMPELPTTAFFPLAPDWVAEIASPHTARWDRMQKMPVYAREGVEWLWLVDPTARTVESYRLEASACEDDRSRRWVLLGVFGDQTDARIQPFEAIELDLTAWWLPA